MEKRKNNKSKSKRGELTWLVLERLTEGVMDFIDLGLTIAISRYGASYGELMRNKEKMQRDRELFFRKMFSDKADRKRLLNTIAYLEMEGLVVKDGKDKYKITKKGITKKRNLLLKYAYLRTDKKEKSLHPILVSFDIPEKFRKKRRWIREVLRNLDFKLVHRSVWIGFTKIPESFIKDLHELKIDKFVEIIELSGKGTLKRLK